MQAFEIFLKIFSISVIRYFIIAGIPFLICYKLMGNWLSQSKIQKRSAIRKDFIREILHSLQTTAVFTFIACLVLLTPLRQVTQIYVAISDYPIWWIPVSIFISLVIHDTYFYWMHRFLHQPKVFRIVHLLHHKSTNPSPWASYSFHFLEAWTEGAVLLVIAVIVPMHVLSLVLFVLISFTINVYGHLGYEVVPKWFRSTPLFEVLSTSVYHNMHHTRFKGNYGLYFRIWDRILKTEHPGYVKEFDRIQCNRFNHQTTLTKAQ
ncbi:MAG: sterol desaturase family protein [Bacteroidota bacterium]